MKRLWSVIACFTTSCAGPATPFGALRTALPASIQVSDGWPFSNLFDSDLTRPKIHFSPARQVLHEKSRWTAIIDDPGGIPRGYSIDLIYNNQVVTGSFLASAHRRISLGGTRLIVSMSDLRLPADQEHQVTLRYRRGPRSKSTAQANFEAPVCHPFQMKPISNTGQFRPKPIWMKSIEDVSRLEGFNPSLLAALIAQESGFNPLAVSWARGLGLTQVTPLADSDLAKIYVDWPRSEVIDRLSAPRLKMLVALGDLTANDDWRLNPQLSIRGGLTYLSMLQKYWTQPSNEARIKSTFGDTESGMLKVILASYNSGPARVNHALQEQGVDFLRASDLNEARRYVSHITSYCDQFSNEVNTDENPS